MERIDLTKNHIVMTPDDIGGYIGSLPNITQGAVGAMEIQVANGDGYVYELINSVTGYYWCEDDEEPEAIAISGDLSTEGNVITWHIDSLDTSRFGRFKVVFDHGGNKSIPVSYNIIFDPSVAGGVTSAADESSSSASASVRQFLVPAGTTAQVMNHGLNKGIDQLGIFVRRVDDGAQATIYTEAGDDATNQVKAVFGIAPQDDLMVTIYQIDASI